MKIDIDLNLLNAEQIALLDAVVSSLPMPSKVKNEIIDAGYANCGEAEYRREYMAKCDLLNGKAIAAAIAEAVKAEREYSESLELHIEYLESWLENWTLSGKTMTGTNDKHILSDDIKAARAAIRARNGAK